MDPVPQNSYPIGILDSGVGGLSILRALQQGLPRESFVYFGDSQNAPYGARSEVEILRLIQHAAALLLQRQIKLLVLGSSTITTVALTDLRSRLTLPIIGTNPAVDLAVDATLSNVVGVLCTRATANGKLLDDLVARFAIPKGVRVLPTWHNDLVPMLERGETDTPALRAILRETLGPLVMAGADQLVLASTHFTWLKPAIRAEFGDAFGFVDSAETVAVEVANILRCEGLSVSTGQGGSTTYLFTGNLGFARAAVAALLNSDSALEATEAQNLVIQSPSPSTP
ncbi:glutamate racemase [Lichenibacterium minor]|uniref:Glutamate racemase n=1 Tax=Lichenibacterium minor TaxID=2316528 RepID=A0A4Q2TZW0_9HYPH|nr:glutamate racemase [Lichenibacterium minor]RYC29689.1 glutamate racemase [Lichenibacterium minor]